MKKNFKFILFAILVMLPLNVMATSTSLSISCPSTASAGDIVSCNINSSTSGGKLSGISSKYDFSSGISFYKFSPGSEWNLVFSNTQSGFAIGNNSGVSSNASIGVLQVKLAEGLSSGTSYKVALTSMSISDTNFVDLSANAPSDTIRIASDNNLLSSLTVSGASFTFNPSTTTYNLTVNSASTVISANKQDSNAKVSGTGTKSLKYGSNKFSIVVTAENGSKKTYTLNITRPDNRSANNNLASLRVSSGNLKFSASTTNYNITVSQNISRVTISATLADSKASFVSGYGPRTVTVSSGTNSYRIIVRSEKGTTKTYTINITKQDNRSSNNNLASLSLSEGTLSFNPSTTTYNVTVDNDVSRITIGATLADSKASFVSGYGPRTVTLNEGFNSYRIIVKNERGINKTYTINITREDGRSSNSYLSSLTISEGNIVFDKNTFEYNVAVAYEVGEIVVDATAEDSKAKLEFQRSNLLKVGENKIVIKVTAENNKVQEYVINVTREEQGVELSNDSTLSKLILDGTSIELVDGTYEYVFKTDNDVIDIQAVTSDKNASVLITGNENLEDGSVITVLVTASDMTTTEYKITIDKDSGSILVPIIIIVILLLIIGGVLVYAFVIKKKKKNNGISASNLSSNASDIPRDGSRINLTTGVRAGDINKIDGEKLDYNNVTNNFQQTNMNSTGISNNNSNSNNDFNNISNYNNNSANLNISNNDNMINSSNINSNYFTNEASNNYNTTESISNFSNNNQQENINNLNNNRNA